jgi:hypothetical protein
VHSAGTACLLPCRPAALGLLLPLSDCWLPLACCCPLLPSAALPAPCASPIPLSQHDLGAMLARPDLASLC